MWRWVSFIVAGIFGLFALVQLNDPDPIPWVIAYGFTAAYTGVSAVRTLPWLQAAVWSAFCLFLGLRLYFTWDGSSNPMGSPDQGVFSEEVVREACGLGLIAVWMGIVAVRNAWMAPPPE
ncbi:MAG: transmembrane 220 family protein [Myxococcota bacterium]